MPFSIVSHWVIDAQQTVLIYGIIVCILLLFHYRKFTYLVYTFGCVSLFIWLDLERFIQQNNRHGMVIYDINGESNVDFTYGKSSYLLGGVNDKTSYVVNQTRIQRGLLPIGEIAPDSNHFPEAAFNNLKVVAWQGKKIIFIAQPFPEDAYLTKPMKVDYLVISHDAIQNLEEITKAFTFTTLIIDSSNRYFTVKKLLQEAHKQGIDAYAVSEKGAYVVNFAHDSHRFF